MAIYPWEFRGAYRGVQWDEIQGYGVEAEGRGQEADVSCTHSFEIAISVFYKDSAGE